MAVEPDTSAPSEAPKGITNFSKVDVASIMKEIEAEEAMEAAEKAAQQQGGGMGGMGMPGMGGMGMPGMGGMGAGGMDMEAMMAQMGMGGMGMGGLGGMGGMNGVGGMPGMEDLAGLPGQDLKALDGKPLAEDTGPSEEALEEVLDKDIDVSGGNGGVLKRITKLGTGPNRPIKGDQVSMTYIGRIPSTDVEFDRNADESSPFSFPLGMGRVIKGWDFAVATMKKGEEAVLTIQPEYGYGKTGAGEKIPPDSVLEFTVKLVSFKNENALDNDGEVVLKKTKENKDHWATPRDGWEVVVKYSARLASATEPLASSDSFLFALPKSGPVLDTELPPYFQHAAKKLKKTEVAEFTVPVEVAKGFKGFEGVEEDVMFEVEMLKWHEFETLERGLINKKLIDEGSDWAKPKDNYPLKVIVLGVSKPSGTSFLRLGNAEEPHAMVLGDATVPEGLEIVLESMKKGEKCEAWVPMELGYGSAARNTEKGIPEADTEMHFVVTMVDFEKIKESYEMNYDEKIEDGQRLKEQGSALLRQGSTKQAVKKYEAALKYFAYEDKTATDEQKKAAAAVRVPCLLNLGNVAAKTSDWEKVFEHANKAVELDPTSIKALYRRAQARTYHLKEYALAISDLKKASDLDKAKGFTAELNAMLKVATDAKKKEDEKTMKTYGGFFNRAKKGNKTVEAEAPAEASA